MVIRGWEGDIVYLYCVESPLEVVGSCVLSLSSVVGGSVEVNPSVKEVVELVLVVLSVSVAVVGMVKPNVNAAIVVCPLSINSLFELRSTTY